MNKERLIPLIVATALFMENMDSTVIAVHVKREQRMHREVVDAIRRHGPPPGYPR